jgi:hypothetical protein
VRFYQNSGAILLEDPGCTVEHIHFRPFHIAFQKIRRRLSPYVLIQGHSVNLDRITRAVCGDVSESAIGRRGGIRARKENRARLRPHGLFLNGNGAEIIARNVYAKARCNLWIGFERHDTALFPHNTRGKKREETDIRADIVRQRTLGVLNDVSGQPAFGAGGLSEDLAWLRANYESLKFRMGLNNYQQESTTFSLRYENFRTLLGTNVGSDDKWRAALGNFPIYRTNLWDVPEFRAYCRPFTPETNGPQPGLVIEFKTEITAGKNFFGWPLSGGDNAYNPSFFATKIDQVQK